MANCRAPLQQWLNASYRFSRSVFTLQSLTYFIKKHQSTPSRAASNYRGALPAPDFSRGGFIVGAGDHLIHLGLVERQRWYTVTGQVAYKFSRKCYNEIQPERKSAVSWEWWLERGQTVGQMSVKLIFRTSEGCVHSAHIYSGCPPILDTENSFKMNL